MTHPLTDDLCHQIADTKDRPFTSIERDNMRAAYDKGRDAQLEQVLNWLIEYIFDHSLHVIEDMPEELAQAMLSQEENNV
jgi:effector-binding domain-containing protein